VSTLRDARRAADPQTALRDAIAALEAAKDGKSAEEKAKLDRFALEVRDVLGRLAAHETALSTEP
jgi:hypothetical protein